MAVVLMLFLEMEVGKSGRLRYIIVDIIGDNMETDL